MQDQLIETWQIHNRINLYLLAGISPDALQACPTKKGRNVGDQFAHMHNVRLMWLSVAAPDLMSSMEKIEKGTILSLADLEAALIESGEAMAQLLARGLETGKIKGFKPSVAAFLGYAIAHESHHRGQIMLTLKLAGQMVDKKVQFGMWEWGVR
ncbi:MAG TPA: DinB family protein [Blastocatellia bacterium]|nr:DinB family protein [Blastocatellia bacterium]